MNNKNNFFDKFTLLITIISIVIISVTGTIFLKIENTNKSTIIKSDESAVIEDKISNSISNNSLYKNGYDADIYGLININTAPKEELVLLENIGEKRAEEIIEYRSLHPFSTTYEITKINGIGKKTYEKIKDKICVE